MLTAWFESAEETFVAGAIGLEGAVVFSTSCKIFKAPIIKFYFTCGSFSILDIKLFLAGQRGLYFDKELSRLDCTPSLEYFHPHFVSVDCCFDAILSYVAQSDHGEVEDINLLSNGSSLLLWASIKVSE